MKLVGREKVLDQARVALEETSGVLLVGEAGIGKSAIAASLAASLPLDGWAVENVRCSAMTTALGWAPLMHLIAPGSSPDPSELSAGLVAEVLRRADDKRLVLVVDDLQHSDPGTASVIFSLVVHHRASVIASTRAGDINTPAVQTLWKEGLLHRIEVPRLSSRAVAEVAEQLTEQPLDAELRSVLVRRADGNPFYATALTRAGVASGAIQGKDGYSFLARPLPASTEIADVLRSQLGSLSSDDYSLMQTIAIGDNMPLELFGGVETQRAIQHLVDEGLVLIDRASPTHATRCAHPLIAEHVREQLPPQHRKDIHENLIARVADYGAAGPLDTLRAISLGLDSDVTVPAEMLLRGGGVALSTFDLDIAHRAAERACQTEPTGPSHLLLGTALAMMGRVDEAKEHWETASALGLDEPDQANLAVAQSRTALFLEFDPERSTAILLDAFATLTESGPRANVGAALVFPLFVGGEYREAVELCAELADYPDLEPPTEVTVLSMLAMGRFMSASFDGLDEVVQRGISLIESGQVQNSLAKIQLEMTEAILLAVDGRFAAATDLVRTRTDLYSISPTSAGVNASWSAMITPVQMLTGELQDTLVHTAIALEETALDDPMGMAPTFVASRVAALAQLGSYEQAQAILDSAPKEPFIVDTRNAFWKAWAEGSLLAETDAAAGARLIAEACETARALGMNYWSWGVLYTAVLFGQPGAVVDQLEQENEASPGMQISLLARHARAAVDRDPDALREVAGDFRYHGGWASAAAAFATEADVESERGNTAAANRASVQATLMKRKCEGPRSPLLDAIANPLSDPEFEVASLAASGETSKSISEKRFVSTRTVDNQLRSVYKKLGISGRGELASVFNPNS